MNPGNSNQFYPENEFNPNDAGKQVYAQTALGTWDGTSDITGNTIVLDLKINDYLNYNNYKYVWVDLGLTNGSVVDASVAAEPLPESTLSVTNLQGPGPGTGADFGFLIEPNPYFEDILINIHADSVNAPAVLDWIDVDTICAPEPATLLLLGLGTAMILRFRKK